MMTLSPRLVVLFDLDLTLLRNPVDREVIAAALETATGVAGALDGFDYRGRSDRWLVDAAAMRYGIDLDTVFERYREAYALKLAEALAPHPPSALPGAMDLLAVLAARPDTTIGVATGNMRHTAAIKIAHAGLAEFFDPLRGGFGDEHDDRAGIVRAAIDECGGRAADRIVVIGDTVHDVKAALAAGATAIGVATGHASTQELAEAGASVVLASLEDAGAVAAALDAARTS